MATYSMNEYQLRLNMGDESFHLEVLNDQDQVVEYFDLMLSTGSVTLSIDDDDYVIGTGTSISSSEEPHKHQVGGGNTQTFSMTTFTGIGIMDLRDMGREGNLTATYDLTCCEMRIDGKDNAYQLWIKIPNTACVDVQPPL